MSNPVVHFEMPYDDAERVAAFYRAAFGWEMQATGPEMGNYVSAWTTATAEDGRPTSPGVINGGFYPRPADGPMRAPSVVVAVEDIDAAMNAVSEGGGEVLGEPILIPGIGLYVSFLDTEGNRASLLQPGGMPEA